MDSYKETIREQAVYFDMPVADAHKLFQKFLHLTPAEARDRMTPWQRAFCIGVYRITKLKNACRGSQRSREAWRERAMELGSPGHLVD